MDLYLGRVAQSSSRRLTGGGSSTSKKEKQQMSLSKQIITERNEKADELAKDGVIMD